MPGKSRHGKGKRHHHSKKSKAIQRHGAVAATPAKTQIPEAAAPTATVVAAPKPPKAVETPAKATTIQYPYVKDELLRIAILAAIIIVVLFILSLIIS
jgi:hypothetical protein